MNARIERVKTSLEIEEDIDIQIKGWIAQRVGWFLMLVFLILAALGFFGDGPLSKETLVDGETALTFEKYTRRESDTEIEITAPARKGMVRVSLSAEFIKTFKIESIVPEPEGQTIDNGNMIVEFPASGNGHLVFYLSVRKDETGRASSNVTVNGSEFALHHYIYL